MSVKAEWTSDDGAIRLICADCVQSMNDIEAGSIDATITSPPYDNLRTYNGYSWDFEKTADGLAKAIKVGGVVVWIVADETVNGSESGSSFRQALYFKDACGLNLHDTMIWEKGVVAFPQSVRYNQKSEFMFVLSKGKPSTFNGIIDHRNVSAGRKVTGKDRVSDGSFRRRSGIGKTCPDFSLRGNVWHVWNQARGIGHPAPFPLSLASDHIISWSNEGETILDPFMGSGTTGVACVNTGRKFIGIEIDEGYFEIAKRRIQKAIRERAELLIPAA